MKSLPVHTPLPWYAVENATTDALLTIEADAISGSGKWRIATVRNANQPVGAANAALIVRAVNSHTAMVRALKDCLIVMHQANAGDTFVANMAREALASAGEEEEEPVVNYMPEA